MGRTGGFALQVLQAFRQPAELTLNGACTDSSASAPNSGSCLPSALVGEMRATASWPRRSAGANPPWTPRQRAGPLDTLRRSRELILRRCPRADKSWGPARFQFQFCRGRDTGCPVPPPSQIPACSVSRTGLAETQNVAQTALGAGNSPKIIFSNYRELVKPADAVKWFSVEPETPASVFPVSMAAVA